MMVRAEVAGDNTLARDLVGVKKTLLSEMDSFSPNYGQARKLFAKNSPGVEELENSIVGKIADVKDTQLKTISGKLFDPTETNPEVIRRAKKLIEDQDPQAWKDITRLEFEKRLGKVKADVEAGNTVENVPGQIQRAIFGNQKQRKVLYSGLDTETRKNVRYLEEGLKRAAKGRPGGSQTATRQVLEKELRGSGISGMIRGYLKNPINTLAETGEDAIYNARVGALAEVMFDPKWQPDLKALRAMKHGDPKADALLLRVLKRAEKDFKKPAAQAAEPDRGE